MFLFLFFILFFPPIWISIWEKRLTHFLSFFFLLYFTLQYCIGFAIHWHESAMGVHELWLRKTRKKESSGTSEKLLLLHLCIEDRDSLCRANQIHSSAFWKLLYFSLLERPHMQDDSWLLAAMWGRASS